MARGGTGESGSEEERIQRKRHAIKARASGGGRLLVFTDRRALAADGQDVSPA